MKETVNILVTSAGTASAVSVIKSLKKQTDLSVRIVAVDMDKLAAGLYLADEHYIVPKASDDNFLPKIFEISEKEKIDIIIPIYSGEIMIFSQNRHLIEKKGIKILLSSPETIELCNNKLDMDRHCRKIGVNVPKVYSREEIQETDFSDYPLFSKPVAGSSSSKGVMKIVNKLEFENFCTGRDDLLYQEFIEGVEVTVDVICDLNSNTLVISPRVRLETKSGQMTKGYTIKDPGLDETVKNICKSINYVGPCNIQFFLKDAKFIVKPQQ